MTHALMSDYDICLMLTRIFLGQEEPDTARAMMKLVGKPLVPDPGELTNTEDYAILPGEEGEMDERG